MYCDVLVPCCSLTNHLSGWHCGMNSAVVCKNNLIISANCCLCVCVCVCLYVCECVCLYLCTFCLCIVSIYMLCDYMCKNMIHHVFDCMCARVFLELCGVSVCFDCVCVCVPYGFYLWKQRDEWSPAKHRWLHSQSPPCFFFSAPQKAGNSGTEGEEYTVQGRRQTENKERRGEKDRGIKGC